MKRRLSPRSKAANIDSHKSVRFLRNIYEMGKPTNCKEEDIGVLPSFKSLCIRKVLYIKFLVFVAPDKSDKSFH